MKGLPMPTPERTSRPLALRRALRPLVAAVLVVVVSAGLLGSTATADARQRDVGDRVTDQRGHDREPETLRLACHADIIGDQRGVLCRWSASNRDDLRGYQLIRIVNGQAREVVATVVPGHRLAFFDTDVQQGDRLTYGVVARNTAGRVIGVGGPVRLGIPGG